MVQAYCNVSVLHFFFDQIKFHFIELKKPIITRHPWLMPVILATSEAEIRRIMVRG
jgi:hypothetical protein